MSKTICIFGDSIAWGATDPVGGGWAGRLSSHFEADPESDNIVYNLGICGDTAEGLLKRFRTECEARAPQTVIFAIGINDSAYFETKDRPVTNTESFCENLLELAKQARLIADKVIFVGLTAVDEARTMPVAWDEGVYYDNENIAAYDAIIKETAQDGGMDYVWLGSLVGNNDLEDGLHPNSAGHQKIFEKIVQLLVNGQN